MDLDPKLRLLFYFTFFPALVSPLNILFLKQYFDFDNF